MSFTLKDSQVERLELGLLVSRDRERIGRVKDGCGGWEVVSRADFRVGEA